MQTDNGGFSEVDINYYLRVPSGILIRFNQTDMSVRSIFSIELYIRFISCLFSRYQDFENSVIISGTFINIRKVMKYNKYKPYGINVTSSKQATSKQQASSSK